MQAVSDRRFGIEIECGAPGGPAAVEDALEENGFLVRKYWAGKRPVRMNGWKSALGYWTVDADGSGVECRTPPLQGERGLEVVYEVMDIILGMGGYVTTADGMHVHFEGLDYIEDRGAVATLLETWADNESIIEQMVSPERWNRGACYRHDDLKRKAKALKETGNDDGLRGRGALNVAGILRNIELRDLPEQAHRRYEYTPKPTVEIRLHQGTLDADQATAWVRFGQRLLDSVMERRRPIMTCASVPQLLYNLRLPEDVRRQLYKDGKSIPQNDGSHPPNEECECDACYEYYYESDRDSWY